MPSIVVNCDANKAFGDNQTMVENGVYAFYAGDVNQDENIDLLDMSQEEVDISNFEYGYFVTDVNGDGNVDLLDIPMLDYNVSNFIFSNHP
jgi:hypothetical protein